MIDLTTMLLRTIIHSIIQQKFQLHSIHAVTRQLTVHFIELQIAHMVFRQAIVEPTTTSGLNTNMNTTINTDHNQHIATTKQWDTVRLTNEESWAMVELTTTSLLPSKRVDKLISMRVLISYTKIILRTSKISQN